MDLSTSFFCYLTIIAENFMAKPNVFRRQLMLQYHVFPNITRLLVRGERNGEGSNKY